MLSPGLVPTRLVDVSERPAIVIADVEPHSRLRTLSAMAALIRFLGGLIALRVPRRAPQWRGGRAPASALRAARGPPAQRRSAALAAHRLVPDRLLSGAGNAAAQRCRVPHSGAPHYRRRPRRADRAVFRGVWRTAGRGRLNRPGASRQIAARGGGCCHQGAKAIRPATVGSIPRRLTRIRPLAINDLPPSNARPQT
jgi:hypothetical protein